MRLLEGSITILAGLILALSPILQIQTASASIPAVSGKACDTSACCCCSMESPGVDDRPVESGCQCSISDSQEPFDVDTNAKDSRVSRDVQYRYESLLLDRFVPLYRPGVVYSAVTYDAGKSPPAYILACSFLI